MGLFQKKQEFNSSAPLYSIGANKSLLIIGLGNPGNEYSGTRHNVGFSVLDEFATKNDFPRWTAKKELTAELTIHTLGDRRVILCKPTTYMNNSGQAAQAVQRFYRVYNQETLAVYDELAIPFGSLRSRQGGSDGGHKGVKSLIEHLGADFGRLRIGIGSDMSKKAEAADFVLGKFSKEEQNKLALIKREAGAILTEFIFSGQLAQGTRDVL